MKKEITIRIDFEEIKHLTVFGSRVSLFGSWSDKDIEQPCLLELSRRLFMKTLNAWLDAKKHICEFYGHGCGQSYGVVVDRFDELEGTTFQDYEGGECLTCNSDSGKPFEVIERPIRVFRVLSFDPVDMEHG